jgi:hypothetical protein
MSYEFLNLLAGSRSRLLREWIDATPCEPRIAWYPSCGNDFRDIVYLSSAFARSNPPSEPEPSPPDLFIHTDYHSSVTGRVDFRPGADLYVGRGSRLTIIEHEELDRLRLPPVSRRSATFPDDARDLGSAHFMKVSFVTPDFGTITAPLLFISAENAAFCETLLLRHRPLISHVVQVRYGHGFGFAYCGPAWLLNVLSRLRTEVLVSDGHHTNQSEERLRDLFLEMPDLQGACSAAGLRSVRTLPSVRWSSHGDVQWLLTPYRNSTVQPEAQANSSA